ncbi:DUF4652 domain-containing protein [Candidatus Clostridium radicumherbarum]|uniref:DUF4652 domain-containing protein n=1 Tax=Candidatus Clostridium radicumherbarum TaxID=3381662 RepID=A0ABW8TPR8_9CLOT
MDCNIFKKRINDLLEDNLSYDLRKAMLEHAESCNNCSTLFKEEHEMDDIFKAGLAVEMQNFRSLRSDIMKNIDKNRYGTGSGKKLIRHFKSYIATYTSLIAIVAVFAFLIPYVKTHGLLGANKSASMAPQNQVMSAAQKADSSNTADNAQNDSSKSMKESADTVKTLIDSSYIPQFEKKQLSKDNNPKFNTPWEASTSNKFSATVEGKGTEAIEEGIASIIVKNSSTGDQWSFNLINNDKQYTPKAVKWIDDENILVIVGGGYGTVDLGGELYILNVNTGLAAKADPKNTAKLNVLSEITKIKSVKAVNASTLSIDTEVLVFEDSSKNKNHSENRTITSPFGEIVNTIK